MGVVVWEEPPPPGGNGLVPHEAIAVALRSRPGAWARIADAGGSTSLVTDINKGRRPAYRPAGHYVAVHRDGMIYARYVAGSLANAVLSQAEAGR